MCIMAAATLFPKTFSKSVTAFFKMHRKQTKEYNGQSRYFSGVKSVFLNFEISARYYECQ